MKIVFNSNGKIKAKISDNVNISDGEMVREVSESELNKLIPDSFEETDWKEVSRHYKLEDGEVVFDKDYEPETEEQ